MDSKLLLRDEMKRLAVEAGFDLAGIAPVADTAEHASFRDWIHAGRAGDMHYLEGRNEHGDLKRASLANAAPWARSVVVCAMNYNTDQPYSTHAGSATQGWISRYAFLQRDYHDVLLPKLRTLEAAVVSLCEARGIEKPRTWCYVDTGPVIERIFAKYAGIGWVAKNTCIINERLGSWLFLGVMLTSIELPADLPPPDRCGSCTRCLDACPTNAFPAPYQLDATKCISYLTIEKRGAIPEDFREGIGRQVFGCDICQDVCPWNRQAPITNEPRFTARAELVNPALEWLARLSLEEFREAFRGTPVKRTKLNGLLRNVAIAMGNSGEHAYLPALKALAEHDDAVLRDAADWAIRRLVASTQLHNTESSALAQHENGSRN